MIDDLRSLIDRYLSGADRSPALVHRIEAEATATVSDDERFDDLMEALALFAPGGRPPYLDEDGLADALREARAAL